jgi:NADH-quinone oxidoreductase subunit H
MLSSMWAIFFMLLLWLVIPTSKHGNFIQFNYEILFLYCITVLGSISILLAGWSSNSKYAFLGAVRAGAQMLSYDLVMGIIILIVVGVTHSTQLIDIVNFQAKNGPLVLYLPMEAVLFMILIIAETNRAPFDFAEAESELVSGYNTEYSGLPFAFFFIAEYGNMLYMSLLTVLLFFGGWSTTFLPETLQINPYAEALVLSIKTILLFYLFIWLRAALPRFRYDQLMNVCWKIFLPLALTSLVVRLILYFFFT